MGFFPFRQPWWRRAPMAQPMAVPATAQVLSGALQASRRRGRRISRRRLAWRWLTWWLGRLVRPLVGIGALALVLALISWPLLTWLAPGWLPGWQQIQARLTTTTTTATAKPGPAAATQAPDTQGADAFPHSTAPLYPADGPLSLQSEQQLHPKEP